jgi:hypothetical protein
MGRDADVALFERAPGEGLGAGARAGIDDGDALLLWASAQGKQPEKRRPRQCRSLLTLLPAELTRRVEKPRSSALDSLKLNPEPTG